MDDSVRALMQAVAIAKNCLEGRTTPLQAGRSISILIGPHHPAWGQIGGARGQLSAFNVAADTSDRVYFLGDQVELWHPDVRDQRRAELAAAEAHATASVHAACRVLLDHVTECGEMVHNLE